MAKKLYYKIGEACKILSIQPYVLRYWETEFPFLNPNKSRSGQRSYSEPELQIIRRIKELLYEEGYTIAGAKKKLEGELSGDVDGLAEQDTDEKGNKGARAKSKPSSKSTNKKADKVDTEAMEKVKKLRSGIEGALHQAQEILGILEADTP